VAPVVQPVTNPLDATLAIAAMVVAILALASTLYLILGIPTT
jgi:hypothetical protein